jgi:hypothetical protein
MVNSLKEVFRLSSFDVFSVALLDTRVESQPFNAGGCHVLKHADDIVR